MFSKRGLLFGVTMGHSPKKDRLPDLKETLNLTHLYVAFRWRFLAQLTACSVAKSRRSIRYLEWIQPKLAPRGAR